MESYIPDVVISTGAAEESTFIGRVFANIFFLTYHTVKTWIMHPQLVAMAGKYLGMTEIPPMQEMEANISLILMNSHFTEEYPRSFPPLVVSVAGMHIKNQSKALPKVSYCMLVSV